MWRNYLASARRSLARNRFYAVINITGLALGVAAALLIVLFVRDEYGYDHFIPAYRDVYLLTESKDETNHQFGTEQWDYAFPDLAAKLSVQFPQIASIARLMTSTDPPHIRHGAVEADEPDFVWVDPSFFQIIPLQALAGDPRTALATPDSVVLTRSAARRYFGRDQPLGEVLEVNPSMGPDATRIASTFGAPHALRVTAIIASACDRAPPCSACGRTSRPMQLAIRRSSPPRIHGWTAFDAHR